MSQDILSPSVSTNMTLLPDRSVRLFQLQASKHPPGAAMPASTEKSHPKVGSVGRRLTPCDACNMFCPRVYIAACGHAYCVGCAVVQQEEHGQLRVMCNECKRRVIADLIEMKDQLVVRDLPFALCPGRVHLKPLGGLGRRLTPCDACNMFSPRVYLCACGHAFCTGCAIVHKEEEEGAGLKAFCLECKKKVTTDLIEIKPSLLRQMRFVCSCGREGTLEQIKEHLWESAESHNVTDFTVYAMRC
ncbi:uncharacterized protein LOC111247839 isoform X1 [Varroa destructor]|uniref:RING-type domain-containing protein n=1 Tax=Varroa destructor TaxID=109461 RepID=A0A7M7JPR1_VARDE|nr:uncharacterized protein LOC111247839 isoform X1 [Varroa destructor]